MPAEAWGHSSQNSSISFSHMLQGRFRERLPRYQVSRQQTSLIITSGRATMFHLEAISRPPRRLLSEVPKYNHSLIMSIHRYYSCDVNLRAGTFAAADSTEAPVGPPQRWVVVATLFLRLRMALVEEYPTVIARTRSAPGITGGLGTGAHERRRILIPGLLRFRKSAGATT